MMDRTGEGYGVAPRADPSPDALCLALETSCDETAAAVVSRRGAVRSSVVASQAALHARHGGVVPELAARHHLEAVLPVAMDALERARAAWADLSLVAVTRGPGLPAALLVGLAAAKAMAYGRGLPLVGVNHLAGHVFAHVLDGDGAPLPRPAACLVVSGSHTDLCLLPPGGGLRLLGTTVDDAAGEAFDKVARFLGLGYPGGPAIDRSAREGDPSAFSFPRALYDEGYDFSFSGLKTAVVRTAERHPEAATADLAASFQDAVVDVLVAKAARAVGDLGAKGLCLGGGVAANSLLRSRAPDAVDVPTYVPSLAMCTDNAAMIAAAGAWRLVHQGPSPLSLAADPNLFLAFDT